MSGRTLVSALVLVLLAVPSGAVAKGVQDAQVCGADGCAAAPLNADTYLVFEGGSPTSPPAERAPFFELRYKTMHEHGRDIDDLTDVRALYLPSAVLLRGEDGTWMRADSRASDAMRRQLADVEPFPASKLDLPGVPLETSDAQAPAGGGGPPILVLLGLVLLAGGTAVAIAGSRRRRRPAAG
jgi:hypothetical protein